MFDVRLGGDLPAAIVAGATASDLREQRPPELLREFIHVLPNRANADVSPVPRRSLSNQYPRERDNGRR